MHAIMLKANTAPNLVLVHDLILHGIAYLVKWPVIPSGVQLVYSRGETVRGAPESGRITFNKESNSLNRRCSKCDRCRRTTCASLRSNERRQRRASLRPSMLQQEVSQHSSSRNSSRWPASRVAVELWLRVVVSPNGTARHLGHGNQQAMRVLMVGGQ